MILILIFCLLIILRINFLEKYEKFGDELPTTATDSEALQNVASLYNTGQMNVNNANIEQDLNVNGKTNLKGATTINGPLTVNGMTTFSVSGMGNTHFPHQSHKKNFIRGNTQLDGTLNVSNHIKIDSGAKLSKGSVNGTTLRGRSFGNGSGLMVDDKIYMGGVPGYISQGIIPMKGNTYLGHPGQPWGGVYANKIQIGNTTITENHLKILTGAIPFYIQSGRSGRNKYLQNDGHQNNAKFNGGKGDWEKLYIRL